MSLANPVVPLPPADSAPVRTWRQGPAAYLELNRPEKANAYNHQMLESLRAIFARLIEQPEVRVIIVCGAGDRSFCAGADLAEFAQRDFQSGLRLQSAELFAQISRCPRVTLAAVNGAAVAGGLELALACDLRIASRSARFWFPEPELGLIPAAGGTQRLAQAVGRARAKEMILGGRVWNAEEALQFGLVSELTAPDQLLALAAQWAERIARRNPTALELAKKAIDMEGPGGAGYSFESVAEALLYHLRSNEGEQG